MSNGKEVSLFNTCNVVCWTLAFAFGLFVACACLYWLGLHGLLSAVIGLFAVLASGVVLPQMACADQGISIAAAPAVPAEPQTQTTEEEAQAAEAAPQVESEAPAEADDLKKISGVGPALEKTLNELGIYKYEQVASWTQADIEWVDARLKFKGRIERDDWVEQARQLSKG